MKLESIASHPQLPVDMPGADRAKMRMLIGPDDGAEKFHMRHFELAAGGHTPHHAHNYEHEILILKGTGTVKSESGDKAFNPGDVIFMPANEKHQFVNDSNAAVEFICLIPAPERCA